MTTERGTVGQRARYLHYESIPIRWNDSDSYGHVNNVQYYSYFDTAINRYLVRSGALDLKNGQLLQFCAESHCKFISELSFLDTVEAGLQVEHLGRTSVRYGIGLFREQEQEPAAIGWLVQVFVDPATRRPAPFTAELRTALEFLQGKERSRDL